MKRLAALLLAGLWLTGAGRVPALELGDIEVGSLRGEPLMARIALVEFAEEDPGNLEVGLGGPEDFARAGIERHAHLVSLEFEVVAGGAEPAHVMIRGRDPVDSPVVTFLVEAVWPGGRTLREYTVPLDAIPPEPVASYGPVHRTDTLWSLAGRYRPEGVSVQRMMLMILELNPHAFSMVNVNALREGAVLEIPSSERMRPDGKALAIEEVRRQNEAWQVYLRAAGEQLAAADVEAPVSADTEAAMPSPEPVPDVAMGNREAIGQRQDAEVRVVVPGTGESADADQQQKLRAELDLALEEADSGRQEIFELSARLDEAEQLIADLQRLVELKDDDIAGLQRRLVAEAEAAEQARSEASAQARAAARARAEAEAQAEAAAQAREEARIQTGLATVEAEALAQAEGTASAQAGVVESATVVAALEPLAGQEQEEGAGRPADAGAAMESAPAVQAEGEDVEPEEASAPPAVLRRLQDMLGFSPVVGGVGLVGVILILGGLIALMRRRRSTPEAPDEEDIPAEDDAAADFWGDEADFEEEGAGFGDDDASTAPAARASEDKRRPAGDVSDMDDFDIGIDLDEELTRSVEREFEPDSDIDQRATTRERALAPARDRAAGPSPSRSALGSGTGEEDLAVDLGGRRIGESDAASPISGHERPRASARRLSDVDPLEGVAAFAAGEGLSGDVDELQTKLDLAQTYIDMEDFENARALLREVQGEGGLEQRAIARYLAGKLP